MDEKREESQFNISFRFKPINMIEKSTLEKSRKY